MENKLKIKFKNQEQYFEILDEEILVDLKTAKHKVKYNIPLDDIKNTWVIQNGSIDIQTNWFYISIFINVILILLIIVLINDGRQSAIQMFAIPMIIPFILLLKNISEVYKEKHITSSRLFYFIYTKKNAEQVDAFIKQVYQHQRALFRKNYFLIDSVLPYNVQFERYIWLYNNKHINENEFDVIKGELDKYFNFNPTI
jgi:hypothetical protein